MRFLNCTTNKKVPSQSILEVGVTEALKEAGFDQTSFLERGGVYAWSNAQKCQQPPPQPQLEW